MEQDGLRLAVAGDAQVEHCMPARVAVEQLELVHVQRDCLRLGPAPYTTAGKRPARRSVATFLPRTARGSAESWGRAMGEPIVTRLYDPPVAASILIVEDEYAVARGIQYALQQEGYEVTVARNGEEGLEIATHNAPDLVILDVRLPGHGRLRGSPAAARHRQQGARSCS